MGSGVALAGDAQPRAVAGAGRNADLHGFGVGHAPIAAAGRARIAQLAGAAAARARQIELHGAGHLADVACPFALRTSDFAGASRAGAVAGAADFVAGDIDPSGGALDGLPEIDIHYIFEVSALLGLGLRRFTAVAEKLGKDVAETGGAGFGSAATGAAGAALRAGKVIGKIEPPEVHSGTGAPASTARSARAGKAVFGVEAVLIVHLALFGIAQDVVGFLNVFEALFGGLSPGLRSGWYLRASLRYAFRTSSASALRGTPSVS